MIAKSKNAYIKDALWISYTGLKDYTSCPRAFYLKNIYRDGKTGYKLQIASPNLTLGAVVHDSLKWFLQMKGQVSEEQLIQKYRNLWLKFRGKRGGFTSLEDEAIFGKRGLQMIHNFFKNYQILGSNLEADGFLKLQLAGSIVLNGRLDFLGQLPDGSLQVIDFKTGSKDEEDPLQLYIYAILAEANFQKPVTKISYWYLDRDEILKEAVLDPLEERLNWITQKSQEIEKLFLENNWVCVSFPKLCKDCQSYQAIIDGLGEFQFSDDAYKKQIYFLQRQLD